MTPQVGVVLVTHDSASWLAHTWDSIIVQDHPITRIVVVDDHSTDDTRTMIGKFCRDPRLGDARVDFVVSTSTAASVTTRIAQNFAQGVLELRTFEAVVLSDHDDVWLPDRVSRHLQSWDAGALMVAGNGSIMSSDETLFDAFQVPSDIDSWDSRSRVRWVIRRSVATGGASMVNARALCEQPGFLPPAGWLHDRWWSILAASRAGLRVDCHPVIDYRVSEHQQVGLDRGRQERRGFSRVAAVSFGDVGRVRALSSLRSIATGDLADEFTLPRLLRTLAG